MLANDIITLALEWQKLKIEQQAVSDFVKKAPYTLEELQVRSPLGYQEFSRYDLFIKTTLDDKDLSKRFGPADLKGQGLAALATLLNSADVTSESERIKVLLRGFELAAKLEALCDEVSDADGMKQIDRIMDDIVVALAAIGPGRTLLVPLLEHDNARIRVLAGRYLVDLMPDRVIPILEKIDTEGDGSPDSFSAYFVLRVWEVEHRGRFKAIEGRVVCG